MKNSKLQVISNMSIGYNDIVTMHVSKIEQEMSSHQKTLQTEIKELSKQISDLETSEELDNLLETVKNKAYDVNRFEKLLQAVNGFSTEYEVKLSICKNDIDKFISEKVITISTDWNFKGQNILRDFSFDIPIPTEIKPILNKIVKLKEKREELRIEATEINKKLSDIPKIERQIKAQITEKILNEGTESIDIKNVLQLT